MFSKFHFSLSPLRRSPYYMSSQKHTSTHSSFPLETEHIIRYTLGPASVVAEVSQITRESRAKAIQTVNATIYI